MDYLYISLVDTPGFFASLIRMFIKQDHIHVNVSFDENLKETYTMGRRVPSIPFFAGLTREKKVEIVKAFPSAHYMIYRVKCTPEQKTSILNRIREDYKRRYSFHYVIIGLPFILMNKPFYQKNHYTCSSYIAKILNEHGISISEKHFSLVTPKDFLLYKDKELLFKGALKKFIAATQAGNEV